MRRTFTKMHGLGNDYIYFDCLTEKFPEPERVAPGLSDRHFGIGGDGIVLMERSKRADFRMRMFNADGSEAEMCGNAIRCVGKYLFENGKTTETELTVQTGAGDLRLWLNVAYGRVESVRVDMSEPVLEGLKIPTFFDLPQVVRQPLEIPGETVRVGGQAVDIAGQTLDVTCVSMGNPHCVVFVDEITDDQVFGLGPKIENHTAFPNRTNAEFARVRSRSEIDMRVWERGSGETMACGTGACAVGVAAVLNDLADRRATVHLNGGDLEIEWAADDNHVYMTGPATYAFEGEVEI